MKKHSEVTRCHKAYLRAKAGLRDQHQDAYALMLERHAQELDSLWANYNLAVKKLAEEHNKAVSRIVPIKKGVKKALPEKSEEKSLSQKATAARFKLLPMKKRVKRELNIEVEEQHGGQNDELVNDITPVNANGPVRNAIFPRFLGFVRL